LDIKTSFIIYKNTTISFTDSGKGTAVVLLHGFLENKEMWQHFVPKLSTKNRIITIDLLGHGNTDCMGYVHTMENNAAVVSAVLQHLKIRKSVVIGHSMGGYVALAFAEIYPDNVKALILLNSTSRADTEDKKQNRDRAIRAVKQDYTTFVRLSIANLFSPDNREKYAIEIENTKKEALKTPLQGIVASLEGMKIRNDREVLLHFAPYKKALVLGKKDPILDFDQTANQIENTDVKLIIFPDGHMSHIENKTELLTELQNYLKTI
jgi:pimeloyl-ACP methyl ester carboxylesterase